MLSHLEPIPTVIAPKPFAYDTIKALVSVKESRWKRRHWRSASLESFPSTWTSSQQMILRTLFPSLPPSEPGKTSVRCLTCKSLPARVDQTAALVTACVNTMFERPHTLDLQPLRLISKPGTPHYLFQHCNFSSFLDKLSPGAFDALIDTLSRFFSFAADFRPTNRIIGQTTHTSRYTYWFLVLSAKILTERSLSDEMLARHYRYDSSGSMVWGTLDGKIFIHSFIIQNDLLQNGPQRKAPLA